MTGNAALHEEVANALKASASGAMQGAWVARDRRKLIPYLALGGASIGMLIGVLTAGSQGLSKREELLGVGLAAGLPSGIVLGWGSFGLAGMLTRNRSRLLPGLRILLSVATYYSASVAAFVAIRVFSGTGNDLVRSFGGLLQATAALGALLIPLSFAMARRASAVSTSSLSGAVGEALETRRPTRLTNVGGTAIIAFVWFLLASFATLGGLMFLRSVAPAAYAAAFDGSGTAMGIGIMVVWVATIVAGTAFTRRLVYERAPSPRAEAEDAVGRRSRRS